MCTEEQNSYILDTKGVKQFLKPNEDFTIGRALNRSLTIEDLRISRTHCRFKEINGVWNIIDESVNGTYLNSNRIQSQKSYILSNGDEIKLTDDIDFKFYENKSNISDMEICDIVDKIEAKHQYNTRSNGTVNKVLNEKVQNGDANVNVAVNDEKEKEGTEGVCNGTNNVEIGENKERALEDKVTEPVTEKVETELQCSICTELFVKAQTLNCSHTFCKTCIDEWKKKNMICPICRAKIKTVTPTIVLDNLVNTVIESSSEEIKENRKILLKEREQLSVKPKKVVKFKRNRMVVRRTVVGGGNSGSTSTDGVTSGGSRNLRPVTRGLNRTLPESILISSSESDSDDYNFFDIDSELDDDSDTMDMLLSDLDQIINQDRSGDLCPDFVRDRYDQYLSGDSRAYYGGYGSCFRCGARGHWANGCPLR